MHGSEQEKLILAFIGNLLFSTRLENVSDTLGMRLKLIENIDLFASEDPLPAIKQYAEHTTGPGAILVDKISAWQPVLIIFDLNHTIIPWREWIAVIKSAPATRRIPVICFGSHMESNTMKDARDAGADAVLARSRFVQDLPDILLKYSRKVDRTGLFESCQETLSKKAIEGLELFNRGEYFEAHEILEEAWNEDTGPGRELYRAVLQVAVAYLQIQRKNYTGAVKMFLRLRQWIEPLPDECRGVNVQKLRVDSQSVFNQLKAAGNERIDLIDRIIFPPVEYKIVE